MRDGLLFFLFPRVETKPQRSPDVSVSGGSAGRLSTAHRFCLSV